MEITFNAAFVVADGHMLCMIARKGVVLQGLGVFDRRVEEIIKKSLAGQAATCEST